MKPKSGIRQDVINLKRERIIETAVELFYDRGFENTTLDAVADELGVRKPYIYSYFESKGDLLAQICMTGVAEAVSSVVSIIEKGGLPAEQLRRICEVTVLTVIKYQKHNVIWSREEKNLLPKHAIKINNIRRQFDRKLNEILVAGCASGDFSISDTHLATLAIGGLSTWVQVWYRTAGRLDAQAIAEGLATLVMTMVNASASPTARVEEAWEGSRRKA